VQHPRECYSRIYCFTLEKCLLTRFPQSVVTGSERNCGINENSEIQRKIPSIP